MSDVVAIQIQPPPGSSGGLRSAQFLERNAHLHPPHFPTRVRGGDGFKTAVPIESLCLPAEFQIQLFTVGRHFEFIIMFQRGWIASNEHLDHVALPEAVPFFLQIRRRKRGQLREGALIAEIQVFI